MTDWWLIGRALVDAGGLALAVEGPSKAEIHCVDNKDGTCSVSYLPTVAGEYSVIIKFADQHIPGSPFTAHITSPCNVSLPIDFPCYADNLFQMRECQYFRLFDGVSFMSAVSDQLAVSVQNINPLSFVSVLNTVYRRPQYDNNQALCRTVSVSKHPS